MTVFCHNNYVNYLQVPCESKEKFMRLVGCGINNMWPIFKAEMKIYRSTANLDEKILFDNLPQFLDPEIRKMLEEYVWEENSHIPFWSMI